jgi:hypothetical protein
MHTTMVGLGNLPMPDQSRTKVPPNQGFHKDTKNMRINFEKHTKQAEKLKKSSRYNIKLTKKLNSMIVMSNQREYHPFVATKKHSEVQGQAPHIGAERVVLGSPPRQQQY